MKEETVIKVAGLTKAFGDFTAVNKISFHVRKGEIFGFLGANGAGKTTAMKMLKSQLYEIELRKKMEARQEIESSKMKIEWGSQIRNYVMHPYKLVKDVRTGEETGNVDNVMDGDIDQFLKAFLMMMGQKEEE